MPDLRELQRKLDSIKALRGIVHAMRNLAATYVRWAEATLEAVRPYGGVVETSLSVVLNRLRSGGQAPLLRGSDPVARSVVVVFASDQGLCGTYNDRVVNAALRFRDEAPGRTDLVAIGHRARGLLALRGVEPALAVGAPTSLEGIRAQVPDLAASIFRAYARRGAGEMVFVYNAYEGMGRFIETVRRILPPEREQLRAGEAHDFTYEPILTASPAALLGPLIEEYFFIELYRALLESHASENGARLAAMTTASSNIDDRLAELTRAFQTARQDAITAELLDVVGGAEALRPGRA